MSIGRNVLKLLSSKVATQVIAFVTAPIIARLYSPDDFGIRQLFMSISTVIVVITCLQYELSIPLGKDEKEASASFTLSLFFTLIFTLVVLAAVPVLKGKIAQWFKAPELKVFLWLLPISVFIGGLGNSLRYWAAREGIFGAMAWSNFGSSLSGRLITIAWAVIIGSSAAGLFAGYFAGAAFGLLLILVFLSRRLVFDIKNAHLNKGWQQIQLPPVKEHGAAIAELIACLNGEVEQHRNNAYQARMTLEILMAIFESVRIHGVVRPPVTVNESPLDIMFESNIL